MTIKRRLFWSNVLMIIIPILVSILLTATITNLILDRLGFGAALHENSGLFSQIIQMTEQGMGGWAEAGSDPKEIMADMEEWGIPSESGAVSFAIYEGESRLYALGNFVEDDLLRIALGRPQSHYLTMDSTALYSVAVGNYHIYLQNTANEYSLGGLFIGAENAPPIGFMIVALVIIIVFVTNRLLTHMVVKSIVTSLDTLVDGVHEIRDGNLSYRIQYAGKDEFAEVCDDFNQMAQQIQRLMEGKQRDDENRRELIAGIAHDLRTPLTSIRAYVEGLSAGVATTIVMQGEYLDTIARKANDLEHIIDQLFQFSKLDIGDFPFALEAMDMGEMLNQYVSTIKEEYRDRGLEIVLHQHMPKGVIVCADHVQLQNVFANLLENSLKYGDIESGRMDISCMLLGDYVQVAFTDNGPGVPEGQLDKLFSPFYRTDKARRDPGQGSGLGLAISDIIVKRLGGTIRARNMNGSGLRVTVLLPLMTGGEEYEAHLNH